MTRWVVVAGLALGMVGAGGCALPGDFEGFRVRGEIEDREDFLEDVAHVFCSKGVDCQSKLGVAGVVQLACHRGLVEEVGVASILRSHPLGPGPAADFDAGAAEECIEAMLALPRCELPLHVVPEPCREVYRGTRQPGERCEATSECAAGRCEFVSDRCPEGVCVESLAAGEVCQEDVDCLLGQVCRLEAVGGTERRCLDPAGEGGPCDSEEDCGELLWCDGGQCRPLPELGESCSVFFNIDPCRAALVCSGPDGMCVEGGQEGTSCDVPCAPGYRCDFGQNECVEVFLPGEEGCTSARNCPAFHECDGERCLPLPVAGEACSPTRQCLFSACDGGTCRELAAGEPCETGQCQGWCDEGAGICREPRQQGDPCPNDPTEPECAPSLTCTTNQCTPCLSFL